MKTLGIISALSLAMMMTSAAVLAGNTDSRGINKRQQNQTERIKGGVQSGALNKRETVGLIVNQAKTHAKEKRYKADGHLSFKERAKLHRDLNQNSRKIYRQKHD